MMIKSPSGTGGKQKGNRRRKSAPDGGLRSVLRSGNAKIQAGMPSPAGSSGQTSRGVRKSGAASSKTAAGSKGSKKQGKIKPWKVILATLLIGVSGFVYIWHVFSTQELYNEVMELRREHEAAERLYQDRSLTYDRLTGPAEVYERAEQQGFIHGGATDPVIELR